MFIYENPYIRTLSFQNLKDIFTSNTAGAYAPMVFLSFMLEYQLFELEPFYYHLDNLLLHLICVFLVYRICLELKLTLSAAIAVALLFAIHPMRVESVAWATERKDVLYGLFFLSSIFFYIKYLSSQKRTKRHLVYAILFFILSALSKIQAVSLPLALLAVDYYEKRPLNWGLIWEKIPFFLISLFFGLLGIFILSSENVLEIGFFSPYERFSIGCYSYLIYIIKSIFPYEMVTMYPYPKTIHGAYLLSPLAVGLILIGCYYLYKTGKRVWLFGLAFFSLNIVFMLQVVAAGQGYLADRYTYIPYFGVFFILGHLFQNWIDHKSVGQYAKYALGVYLFVFAYMTWQQCKVWKDSESLWTHNIIHRPEAVNAWANRGDHYRMQKDYQKALADYHKAIEMKSTVAAIFHGRGQTYLEIGDPHNSILDYNRAIELADSVSIFYVNRGAAYASLKDYAAAIKDEEKALELNPENYEAYRNLSKMRYFIGEYQKGIENAEMYFSFNPIKPDIDVWLMKGASERQLKKYEEAIQSFENAIAIDPNYGQIYTQRAIVYRQMGAEQKAIADEQRANRLR